MDSQNFRELICNYFSFFICINKRYRLYLKCRIKSFTSRLLWVMPSITTRVTVFFAFSSLVHINYFISSEQSFFRYKSNVEGIIINGGILNMPAYSYMGGVLSHRRKAARRGVSNASEIAASPNQSTEAPTFNHIFIAKKVEMS